MTAAIYARVSTQADTVIVQHERTIRTRKGTKHLVEIRKPVSNGEINRMEGGSATWGDVEQFWSGTFDPHSVPQVPEPTSLLLLGTGLLSVLRTTRRRRR